jgi:hypothetical protein
MASYVKYNQFVEDLANAVHHLFGTTDTLKVALTNTAPNVSTHAVRADITELSTSGGYTSGGADTQNDSTRTGDTLTATAVDVVFTATSGFGPFRYVVLYNDTPTSPADPLIAYWDYGGSGVTLGASETFTVDFGASLFTIQ